MAETQEMTETERLTRLQESLASGKKKEKPPLGASTAPWDQPKEEKTMPMPKTKTPRKKRVKPPEEKPGETGMKERQRKAAKPKAARRKTRTPRALKPLIEKEKELVARLAAIRVLIREFKVVLRS